MNRPTPTIVLYFFLIPLIPATFAQTEVVNPSRIPEANEFLDALVQFPDYQSETAKCQALVAFKKVIQDLNTDLVVRKTLNPRLASSLDPVIEEFNRKIDRYNKFTRERLSAFEGEAYREAASPSSLTRLLVIETFAPEYAAIQPKLFQAIREEASADREKRDAAAAKKAENAAVAERFSEHNGIIHFAVGGVLFIVLAFITRRSIKDIGFSFQMDSVVGEVMREEKSSHTKFYETITHSPHRNQAPNRSTSSTTTNFQEIFLKLPNGKERVLDFKNFKIPCREGNRLSAFFLNRNGGAFQTIAYHNHSTDKTTHIPGAIIKRIKTHISKKLSLAWLILFIYGAYLFALVKGYLEFGLETDNMIFIGGCAFVNWLIFKAIYNSMSTSHANSRLGEIKLKMRQMIAVNEVRIPG